MNIQIVELDNINSTHTYLLDLIKQNKLIDEYILVISKNQTQSIGTRGKEWISIEGNLFFSLKIPLSFLVKDLKLESSSIYFAMILTKVLQNLGSKATLKWPNDIFIEKKIAGILSQKIEDSIIISIGLNTSKKPDLFDKLDIKCTNKQILKLFLNQVDKKPSWKNIFNDFKIEFANNKNKTFTINNQKILLKNTILCNDGSILVNNDRVYSIR